MEKAVKALEGRMASVEASLRDFRAPVGGLEGFTALIQKGLSRVRALHGSLA